ncbi:MAG: sensor histidine kinase [Streptosporangiaceae bacterium]
MSALGWLRRSARRHPQVADVTIAAALFAVTLLTTATGPANWRGQLSLGAVAAAGAAYGALVWRQRWPWLTLAVAAAGAEVYMALSHADVGVFGAPLIALYTVADTAGARRSAVTVGGLIVLALAGVHAVLHPSQWLSPENLVLASLGGLAVAAGDASRSRRAYIAEVEERARRAERDREQEARRRVTEERLRIARDLHDVIGHHIALINVQAGVADHVLENQPDQARQALTHIRRASRAALGDLRDTVGLLRQPGEAAAPLEPVAGLAGLEELVGSFVRSGLRVGHQIDGEVRPIPAAADLTAYRVIQESLTNVSKHAADATATVWLSYQNAALRIVVEDDGNGVPPTPGSAEHGVGHGITGMRERVTASGGQLIVCRKPHRGFLVSATLPLSDGGAG